jgi:ribosomal protein S18 acetylase RimI-like enzyme
MAADERPAFSALPAEVGDEGSPPVIRTGGEGDLPEVLRLWREHGRIVTAVPDIEDALQRLLQTDSEALIVAELDDRLVASLIAAWDGHRGNFYRLVVSAKQRGRCLARRLIAEGERRLAEKGCRRITALIDDSDPAASRTWRAAGYEHDPHSIRYVKNTFGP